MKADVIEVGTCRYKVDVEIPVEQVDAEFDKVYGTLKNRVSIKGFRRGHVPRRILQRQHGEDVARDVSVTLFQKSFMDALKEKDLSPLGEPDITIEELKAEAGKPFAFCTEIDVRPQFDLPEYKGIKLEEELSAATEEELNDNLKRLQKGFATFSDSEDGFKKGDAITLDMKMMVEGEAVMERDGFRLPPEAQYLMGLEIEDAQEQMEGLKVGDEKTFKVEVPEEFYEKKAAGKDAEIIAKVIKVEVADYPELNDELAERVGMKTFDELKEKIKENMDAEKKQAARGILAEKVVDDLLAKVEMELPEAYITRQVESRIDTKRQEFARMGDNIPDDADKQIEDMKESAKEESEKATRRFAVLDAIAEKENIQISQQDMAQYVQNLAMQYGIPPEQMMQMMQQQGSMQYVMQDVRDAKVVDFLVDNADITTVEK